MANANIIQMQFDLFKCRHVNGKKDASRVFTIVEGVTVLPSGEKAFCEVFLVTNVEYTPGPHVLTMQIGVNMDRKLEIRCTDCRPVAVAARAAA